METRGRTKSNPKHAPFRKGSVSQRYGDYQLIPYFLYKKNEKQYELYNLASDPEEQVNEYFTNPSLAHGLQRELEEKLSAVNEQYTSSTSLGGDRSDVQG